MNKKYLLITAILIAAVVLGSCEKDESGETSPFSGIENLDSRASYAMGMNVAIELLDTMIVSEIFPNLEDFLQGMSDIMMNRETRINFYEGYDLMENALNSIMNERVEAATQMENQFLAENARRSEVNVTPSGLQYEVFVEGTGPSPSITDTVIVHYEGSLLDGMIFDSSYEEEGAYIPLDMVIPGWAEGVMLMNVGSIYRFYIPSSMGYGRDGIQGIIPPFSTLIFIVELLEIL